MHVSQSKHGNANQKRTTAASNSDHNYGSDWYSGLLWWAAGKSVLGRKE